MKLVKKIITVTPRIIKKKKKILKHDNHNNNDDEIKFQEDLDYVKINKKE